MYIFDLTTLSPAGVPLVEDYASLLSSDGLEALLSEGQAPGAYSLAGGASSFAEGVQICLDTGVCLGLLRLHDGFCFNGLCYTLTLAGDELQLVVSGDATERVEGLSAGAGETTSFPGKSPWLTTGYSFWMSWRGCPRPPSRRSGGRWKTGR